MEKMTLNGPMGKKSLVNSLGVLKSKVEDLHNLYIESETLVSSLKRTSRPIVEKDKQGTPTDILLDLIDMFDYAIAGIDEKIQQIGKNITEARCMIE
jgi:hypothetical protein